MTFKAGDRVRHQDKVGPWAGWEGTVQSEFGGVTTALTDAFNGYGAEVRLTTANLELIDPPFTYEDIQVGDKIRRTLTCDTGTTEVREGTVVSKNGGLAVDSDGPLSYILAYATDTVRNELVVLELLGRPEPKHWTETKPVGSVAVILDGRFTKTITKTAENEWKVVYSVDEYTYTDHNKFLKIRAEGWGESKLTWIK